MIPRPKQPKRNTVAITTFITLSGIVALFGWWNWYTHYTDKQKFMTLKQDMLTLQAEFNKIDPGWQYTEWCHAKGEKFKQNEASSCGVEMSMNKKTDINNYTRIMKEKNIINDYIEYSFDNNNEHVSGFDSKYVKNNNIKCGVSLRSSDEHDVTVVGCHDSALDFYFPKTQ